MVNQQQVEYLFSFFRHVKKDSDPEISILKSHLLIESLAKDFIRQRLKKPELLQKLHLKTSQTILLAKALDDSPGVADWAWEAAEKLNSIRNHLSHELTPKDLKARMDELIAFVDSKTTLMQGFEKDFGPFVTRIIMIWTALCVCLHFDPVALGAVGKTLLSGGPPNE